MYYRSQHHGDVSEDSPDLEGREPAGGKEDIGYHFILQSALVKIIPESPQ